MGKIKSSLNFVNYIVDNVEFYSNPKCTEKVFDIDFDIDSEVNYVNDSNFLVTLYVKIFEDADKNGYPFSMKIKLTGAFKVENVNEDTKQVFAEKNSVAILFPYVRALVSTYTSASNVQPVILPPINVVNYLQNKKENKNK